MAVRGLLVASPLLNKVPTPIVAQKTSHQSQERYLCDGRDNEPHQESSQ